MKKILILILIFTCISSNVFAASKTVKIICGSLCFIGAIICFNEAYTYKVERWSAMEKTGEFFDWSSMQYIPIHTVVNHKEENTKYAPDLTLTLGFIFSAVGTSYFIMAFEKDQIKIKKHLIKF